MSCAWRVIGLTVSVSALVLEGCLFTPTTQEAPLIACSTNDDCPDGYVCRLQLCAVDAPLLPAEVLSLDVSADVVSSSDALNITMQLDRPVEQPRMRVGDNVFLLDEADATQTRLRFTGFVLGDDGEVPARFSYLDRGQDIEQDVATVTLDNTGPSIAFVDAPSVVGAQLPRVRLQLVGGMLQSAQLRHADLNQVQALMVRDNEILAQPLTLPEGELVLSVVAQDNVGNVVTADTRMRADLLAPSVLATEASLTRAAPNTAISMTVLLSEAPVEAPSVSVDDQAASCTLSGVSLSCVFRAITSAPVWVSSMRDAAGNISAPVQLTTIEVDNAAPRCNVEVNRVVLSQTAPHRELLATVSSDELVRVGAQLEGCALACTEGLCALDVVTCPLAHGEATLLVRCTDEVGNTTTVATPVRVDLLGPVATTTATQVRSGGPLSLTFDEALVSGTAAFANDTASATGTVEVIGAAGVVNVPLLADGAYALTVEALDGFGNTRTTLLRTVFIDNDAPELVEFNVSATTVQKNATVVVSALMNEALAVAPSAMVGDRVTSCSVVGALVTCSLTMEVTSTIILEGVVDAAGNERSLALGSVVVDDTPPLLGALSTNRTRLSVARDSDVTATAACEPGTDVRAQLGTCEMSCTNDQAQCRCDVVLTESCAATGAAALVMTLTDNVGNRSQQSTTLIVDNQGPLLVGIGDYQLGVPWHQVPHEVQLIEPNTEVRLVANLTELVDASTLDAALVNRSDGSEQPLTLLEQAFNADGEVQLLFGARTLPLLTAGAYEFELRSTDLAGNPLTTTATMPSPGFVVNPSLERTCRAILDDGRAGCTDFDGDGFHGQAGCGTDVDCDDLTATTFPGAVEFPGDDRDNDCDSTSITLDEANAIFLSTTGNDASPGTRAAPVASLAQALTLAATNKFVAIADGAYEFNGAVTLQRGLIGGLDAGWKRQNSRPVVLSQNPNALIAFSMAPGAGISQVDFQFSCGGLGIAENMLVEQSSITFLQAGCAAGVVSAINVRNTFWNIDVVGSSFHATGTAHVIDSRFDSPGDALSVSGDVTLIRSRMVANNFPIVLSGSAPIQVRIVSSVLHNRFSGFFGRGLRAIAGAGARVEMVFSTMLATGEGIDADEFAPSNEVVAVASLLLSSSANVSVGAQGTTTLVGNVMKSSTCAAFVGGCQTINMVNACTHATCADARDNVAISTPLVDSSYAMLADAPVLNSLSSFEQLGLPADAVADMHGDCRGRDQLEPGADEVNP
jgi:hypothetical protein